MRLVAGGHESEAVKAWRDHACRLEDELQWHRDALLDARSQTYDEMLMSCDGAKDISVLVEVSDPSEKRKSKHVPLEELLR